MAMAAAPLPPFDPDELCALFFQGPASAFEHRLPFFFAAISCGWALHIALDLFGSLGEGVYSTNGCCFCVDGARAPDDRAWRHVIAAEGFLDGIAIWILDQRITHIVATCSMAAWRAFLVDCAQSAQGFLPSIMRLPREETSGQLIVPGCG
jgi:hypothetical protein